MLDYLERGIDYIVVLRDWIMYIQTYTSILSQLELNSVSFIASINYSAVLLKLLGLGVQNPKTRN